MPRRQIWYIVELASWRQSPQDESVLWGSSILKSFEVIRRSTYRITKVTIRGLEYNGSVQTFQCIPVYL